MLAAPLQGGGSAGRCGVAERECLAFGREQPVSLSRAGACDGDHRPEKICAAQRAEEPGVAEREHTAVGGDKPVTAAVARGSDANDGLVQDDVSTRREEPAA